PGRTVEMTGAWKTRKTKPRFPLRFPQPLEIAARFPHSHRPGGWLCSKTLKIKTQERRPCWRIASLPPLGSFFNEKMLPTTATVVAQFEPRVNFSLWLSARED